MSLLVAECLDGPFSMRSIPEVLKRRAPLLVTDCKSLYDRMSSPSSPTAVEDRRTSIDIAIIRESCANCGSIIRWVPTAHMIADSLTKDAGDPIDLLRTCIRSPTYQISPESEVLKQQALEKQRRLDRNKSAVSASITEE